MVTSFISISLNRSGFSFCKLKWKRKNELQIWISKSSYFKNRKTILFHVICLKFSIKTKIETLFLISHFNLPKNLKTSALQILMMVILAQIVSNVNLTHSRPMFPSYTPWKSRKSSYFLTFSRGIERQHWPEMA